MRTTVLALLGTIATASHAAPELVWQDAFTIETPVVHFRARYTEQGEGHRIDVWRTAIRVRRDTDDRVTVVATEEGQDVRIDVLDRIRGMVMHTRRGSLLRSGMFVDAFELRTGLRKPGGPHSLARSDRSPVVSSRGACTWLTIRTPMEAIDVCWSERFGIPMRIEQLGRPVFVVDAVEERTASDAQFRLSAPIDVDPSGVDDD